MQKKSVSVIIPVYNREKTIERCIDSIIQQTVKPDEIIVIDDGSTDGTVKILDELQLKYNYLSVIRQNHRGAQAARNLGILNAKGEYIAFLDSDDEWLPQMLERELGIALKEQGKCVLYGDCYIYNGCDKRLWRLSGHTGNMYISLLRRPGPMFQSLFAPKELFFKIGLLDENVVAYQEWDTVIRLAKEAKFVYIHEPLFIYHQHEGETISKDLNRSIKGYAYIVKKFQKEILEKSGLKTLNKHYKILIEKSLNCRNIRVVAFVWKIFSINAFMIFRRKEKNLKYTFVK